MLVRPVRLAVGLLVCSAACTAEPMFPASVMKSVDSTKQYAIFNPEADTYFKGLTVLAGGRVVSVSQKNDGFLIVAQELPVRNRPSRMPMDGVKPIGDFVFLYQGDIEPAGIQNGNKFILVGEIRGTETMTINGAAKAVPYLIVQCLHVWKTGRYAIADFPDLPDGFYPLEEQTYCTPKK